MRYIDLPIAVENILNKLNESGHSAYIVGGCVRDSVLRREPKDWDICTDAVPERVIEIFGDKNVIPTGIKYGTVTILKDGCGYEVTTFRSDSEYSDGRRPDAVKYSDNIIDDLARRDFTMNAMAYNHTEGVVDPYMGIKDIRSHIIRCVGEPDERFTEDGLRIMRAFRFAAQLGFDIEDSSYDSIERNREFVRNVSAERVQAELNKILVSDNLSVLAMMQESGVMEIILPELARCFDVKQNNPHHNACIGMHIINAVSNVEPELPLRLTVLLHDIGKVDTKITDENGIDHFYGHAEVSSGLAVDIMKRLKYDSNTIEKVSCYVKYHEFQLEAKPSSIKRFMLKVGQSALEDIIKIRRADIMAQSSFRHGDKMLALSEVSRVYYQVLESNTCFTQKDLAINGKDLIALGFREGKDIGSILKSALHYVIDNPDSNDKDILIGMVRAGQFA